MEASQSVTTTIRMKRLMDMVEPYIAKHGDPTDGEQPRILAACDDFRRACISDLQRAKESLDYAEKCGDLKGR